VKQFCQLEVQGAAMSAVNLFPARVMDQAREIEQYKVSELR
jgi:hypothetical protein